MRRLSLLMILVAAFSSAVAATKKDYPQAAPRAQPGGYFFEVDRRVRPATEVFAPAVLASPDIPVYYFQKFGGGSLALGVALGPLGVLANTAISRSDQNEGAKGIPSTTELVPFTAIETAASEAQGGNGIAGKQFLLRPFVMIVRGESDVVHMLLAIDASAEEWSSRYTFHIPESFNYEEFSSGLSQEKADTLNQGMASAAAHLIALLRRDIEAGLPRLAEHAIFEDSIAPKAKRNFYAVLVEEADGQAVYAISMPKISLKYTLAYGYHVFPAGQVTVRDR